MTIYLEKKGSWFSATLKGRGEKEGSLPIIGGSRKSGREGRGGKTSRFSVGDRN